MKKILVSILLLVFCLCLNGCNKNNNTKKPTIEMLYSDWYNCAKLPNMEDPFAEAYDGYYSIKIDKSNNMTFKSINQEQLNGILEYDQKENNIDIIITFENNDVANGSLTISNNVPYLNFWYNGTRYCFTNTRSISKDEFETYRANFNSFLRDSFINNSYPTIDEVEYSELYKEYTNFVHIDPCCNGPKRYVEVNKVNIIFDIEKNEVSATYNSGETKNINAYDIDKIVLVKMDGTFERLEEIKEGQCYLTNDYSIFYFECEHQWDEGIEINRTEKNYTLEYTCRICNEKYQQIYDINENVTYSLTVTGDTKYLKNDISGYYAPLTKIKIEVQKLIDADIEVYVNGNQILHSSSSEPQFDYLLFEFDSLETDMVVEIRIKAIEYINIIFNGNGGTLIAGEKNQTVLNLEDVSYPTYEYYGYIVDKYNITESDVDGVYYIDVIWKRNPDLYKLEIKLDNKVYYSNFYQAGENIEINLPSKDHYNLISDIEIPNVMPLNDVIVNLNFEIEKVYLYVWYESNEVGVQELEYDYGDFVYESDLDTSFDLTKKGYTFNGWDREFPFKIEEAMDIYAVWDPILFHLIFDGMGADTLELEEMFIKYGEHVTLPIPEKEGFNFEGWYYYTERIQNGEWKRLNNDNQLTVIAKWSYNRDYYEFGKYPQTHVSDSNLIEELNKLTEVNEHGYYVYNNEEYCKISATPIVENELYYSDGTVATRKTEWFKVEPIKWIVKGTNTYTLYPMKLLDVVIYDQNGNAYSKSQIRQYLNNDFLNTAFSKEEIELLLPIDQFITEVKVEGTSITTTGIGISDNVMLYSVMTKAENKELTDYAIARGASLTKVTNKTTNITKYYGSWWIIEQSQVSNFGYKQTYFSSYEEDYKYAEGTRLGICFNIRIILQL